MNREICEKVCQEKDLQLSEMADKIIEKITLKGDLCPCRLKPTPCPCDELDQDIAKTGRCTCNLYINKVKKEKE